MNSNRLNVRYESTKIKKKWESLSKNLMACCRLPNRVWMDEDFIYIDFDETYYRMEINDSITKRLIDEKYGY